MHTRQVLGWAALIVSDVTVQPVQCGHSGRSAESTKVGADSSWTLVDRAAGATFWDHYDFFTARVSEMRGDRVGRVGVPPPPP